MSALAEALVAACAEWAEKSRALEKATLARDRARREYDAAALALVAAWEANGGCSS